jgi:hypothetical protein
MENDMPWRNNAAKVGMMGPKVFAELGTKIVQAAIKQGNFELAVQTLDRIGRVTGGWVEDKPSSARPRNRGEG